MDGVNSVLTASSVQSEFNGRRPQEEGGNRHVFFIVICGK